MNFKLTAPQPQWSDEPDRYLPIAQTCFFSLRCESMGLNSSSPLCDCSDSVCLGPYCVRFKFSVFGWELVCLHT
jgi:hypothetical protein